MPRISWLGGQELQYQNISFMWAPPLYVLMFVCLCVEIDKYIGFTLLEFFLQFVGTIFHFFLGFVNIVKPNYHLNLEPYSPKIFLSNFVMVLILSLLYSHRKEILMTWLQKIIWSAKLKAQGGSKTNNVFIYINIKK